MTLNDLKTIAKWYEDDPKGRKFLGGYDNKELLSLVNGSNRFMWLVQQEGAAVGFIDLEINDGIGSLAYFVAKEYRERGLGTDILIEFESLARDCGVKELRGSFEPDNFASRRALEKAGHVIATTLDEEEMIRATKKIGSD